MTSTNSNKEDTEIAKIINGDKSRGWVRLILTIGAIVYLGGLIYAASSNFGLLVMRGDPSLQIWMAMGVILTALSTVGLPLALHYWTISGAHRIAALVFYVVELFLLGFNAVVEFRLDKGVQIDSALKFYLEVVAPMIPIMIAAGWGTLFVLDPAHKFTQGMLELAQSVRLAKLETIKLNTMNHVELLKAGANNSALDLVTGIAGNTAPIPQQMSTFNATAGGGVPVIDQRAEIERLKNVIEQLREEIHSRPNG